MAAPNNDSQVPGEPTATGTSLLETATSAIQSFAPVNNIHQHLCAFHFYADDMTRQVEAHHFCGHLNEEVRQCLIFDGPEKTSRLIGVEYIVPEHIFLTLPDEEKKLWHSHLFEVKGAILFMPRLPRPIELHEMEILSKTYGKTYHFWQVDKGHPLPFGLPQLMMAFTRDGQIDQDLLHNVGQRFGVDFKKEREKREYIPGLVHGVHPLANAGGKGLKTVLREVPLSPDDVLPPGAARVFV
ncbi:oil body-associated protein 1A-like [Neltuma alba]|uniref:oil body-associated protein 1A-like n=1 Tax=Neltuma alba TaxID=207710 RepID=UPI0010A445D6|nr:oil body-associated protein 1A-like [Prosopis alba]